MAATAKIVVAAVKSPQGQKVLKGIAAVFCVFLLGFCAMCGKQYQTDNVKTVAAYFRNPLATEYIPNLSIDSAALDTKLLYATYIIIFMDGELTKTNKGIEETVDRLLSCFFEITEVTRTDTDGKEVKEEKYIVIIDEEKIFQKIEKTFQLIITENIITEIHDLKELITAAGGFGSASELSEFALQFVGEGHSRFTSYTASTGDQAFQADWCAFFVSYCLDQCDMIPNVYPRFFAGCTTETNRLKSDGMFEPAGSYEPSAGDIIFFTNDHASSYHVGIVTNFDGNTVYTVEGNTGVSTYPNGAYWSGSLVEEHQYDINSSNIYGYFSTNKYTDNQQTTTKR